MSEFAPTILPTAQPAEPPKLTFAAILDLMLAADEGAETQIDLKDLGELARDKVDAIREVIERLKAYEEKLKGDIDELSKSRRAVAANRERLREYVAHHMAEKGFEKLPGIRWRIALQKSPPALVIDRPATAQDFIHMPNLVKQHRVYEWDKEALRVHIESGEGVEFARLERGEFVKFYAQKEKAL